MKKLSLIISAFAFFLNTDTVKAQEPSFHKVELGIRFMPTLSSVSMQSSSGSTISGNATLGFGFGGFLGLNFTNHVGGAVEVLYNSVSQKYKDEGLDREMKVKYVTIPMLLSLNSGVERPVNIKVEFGPQFGLNVGSSMKTHGDTLQTVLSTKQAGLGVAYGTGLGFILNEKQTTRLDIGYRGVYGTRIKTNALYFGFTLLF